MWLHLTNIRNYTNSVDGLGDLDEVFAFECEGLKSVVKFICRWNLARKMVSESYGLVFGLNSFVALVLQTVLTMVVVDKRGLGMSVRSQVPFFISNLLVF